MVTVEKVENVQKIMLTVKEFSKVSGIGEKNVRRLAHMDSFPAMKNGVKILIHRKKADAWLADYSVNRDGSLPVIRD